MSRASFAKDASDAADALYGVFEEHPKTVTALAAVFFAGVVFYVSEEAYEYAKRKPDKAILGVAAVAATVYVASEVLKA